MPNFLSTALGKGEYTKDNTEKIKIKVPESTTSIPIELIKKIDKEESEYYEKLKKDEIKEKEEFFGLKADIKTFDEYDKMQSNGSRSPLNAGVHKVDRLKVVGSESSSSSEAKVSAGIELLRKLEQSVKVDLGVEVLPKAASDSLKTLVDSLDGIIEYTKKRSKESELRSPETLEVRSKDSELPNVEELTANSQDSNLGSMELVNADSDKSKLQDTDRLQVKSSTSQLDSKETLDTSITIPKEVVDELETKLLEFKDKGLIDTEVYEKLKVEFGAISEDDTVTLNVNREKFLGALYNLKNTYAETLKLNEPKSYTDKEFEPLNKPDMGSSVEENKSALARFWNAYLAADSSTPITLSNDLLVNMYESIGVPSRYTQKMHTAVDTLSSRFGLTDVLAKATGFGYSQYSDALNYAKIATQIRQAASGNGVIEISTENLLFVATFMAFMDPLQLEAPTTRGRGLSKGMKIVRGFANAIGLDSKLTDSDDGFFHNDKIDNLPFKGYESVKNIELLDTSHWDIKLEKIRWSDLGVDSPTEMDLTKVPLPRFSENWWNSSPKEIEGGAWLPINSFTINLTNPNYETIDPFNMLPMQMFSGVSYPMYGTLECMETNTLWLRNWMREYCNACYEADGVTSKFTYHEMSYKMSIYIWDAFEAVTDKKKIYESLYKGNGNDSKFTSPNGPKCREDSFIRKYVLYILPQIQGENWSGTATNNLLEKTTINFSIVGGEGVSMMKLDQMGYKSDKLNFNLEL